METNVIYCGDNLGVLPKYIPDESVDLIYIDPPFNTSRNYEVLWGEAEERRAFDDRFGDAVTYLEWMRPRIRELYRVLKPTGHFFYHCDWHASHYIKMELDRLFTFEALRNEIVWHYYNKLHDRRKGLLPRATDSIFWYVKNPDLPYTFHQPYEKRETPRRMLARKKVAGRAVNVKDEAGQLVYITTDKRTVTNVWSIAGVVPASRHYLGWPTQKPLPLLERIVEMASNPGDIVLDAFCGCGTTLEAAAKLKRRWIGIDFSPTACRVMRDRLEKFLGLRLDVDFRIVDMPKSEEELRSLPHVEFENWAVIALGGIPNRVKVGDYGIDGRLYAADREKAKVERPGTMFDVLDRWYPIQVKQQDRVGRPDMDKFETAMRRDKRTKGYFVAFGFSRDALREIRRANQHDGLDIVPITVAEILRHEQVVA
jgi:DNA modification methylase